MTRAKRALRRFGWPMLGLALLVNAGCLLAAAGAAAGAGAGYVYYNGLIYRDYPVHLADATAAVRAALTDLQLAVEKETTDTGSVVIRSRTAQGDTIRVYLDLTSSPLPIDGVMTRISVRVGFSGDDGVSTRLLDQVSAVLSKRVPVPAAGPGPGAPALGAPKVTESAQPPLAPPVPVKK